MGRRKFLKDHERQELFGIPRHDISSNHYRELRATAMNLWAKIARAEATESTDGLAFGWWPLS